MQLTNRLNLPLPIVRAVQHDDYEQSGDISVTGLIQPPRIRQLTSRHRGDISIDVADRIWPLLGSNTHYILERAQVDNALQEERLSIEVNGWTITGKPDLYYNQTVYDFKVTSVWSVLNGVKPEWGIQTNLYAHLLRHCNFSIEAATIICILRDWSKHQVKRSSNYPGTQVVMLPVKLWTQEETRKYILTRVQLHQEAEHLSDADLPVCTPQERWEKSTTYAVKVKGQKRAQRVLESMEAAEGWTSENMKKAYEIEVRPGESVRCMSYCDCNNYCSFYQEIKRGNNGDERITTDTK